ncbi:17283_t:CDS:1, partial [Acaulospora colombiana]
RVREMRHEEDALSEAGSTTSSTVMESLSRLGNRAWKGMVNEVEDEDRSPSPDDRFETRVEAPPTLTVTSPVSETSNSKSFFSFGGGLGSKITESVWKGMTNQVDSPEPSPEASPVPSPTVPRHSASIPPIQNHRMVAPIPSSTPEQNASTTWSGDGAASWAKGYASKLWNSNTASSLSRAGTVLKNRASDAWSQGSVSEAEPRSTTHSPSQSIQFDKRSSAGSSRADGFASP